MAKNELKILIGIHRCMNDLDRKSANILKPYGLTLPQFSVLEALYHKGDLCIGSLTKCILSSSGTIPIIINGLIKRGYIERYSDVNDKRRSFLHLRDEGRVLIEKVYPLNEAMIIKELAIYSDSQQIQLVELLKQYQTSIKQ